MLVEAAQVGLGGEELVDTEQYLPVGIQHIEGQLHSQSEESEGVPRDLRSHTRDFHVAGLEGQREIAVGHYGDLVEEAA